MRTPYSKCTWRGIVAGRQRRGRTPPPAPALPRPRRHLVRLVRARVDPPRAIHGTSHSPNALLALPSGIQLHRFVETRFAGPPEFHLALLVRLVAQLFGPGARDLVRPRQSPVIGADVV